VSRRGLRLLPVAALLAVTGLAAGCGHSASPTSRASSQPSELTDHTSSVYQGVGETPPLPRPQFSLTDQNGAAYNFGQQTRGKPTLLYFGYTHCPDVCPTTLADISQALAAVPAKVRQATQVVFVTTDVKRDTPGVLKAYLAQFDTGLPNRFIGLTGSQAQVDAAQVAAHVALAEDGGQTHSASVLLYGSDNYARVSYLQSTGEAGQIAHDLPLIAG